MGNYLTDRLAQMQAEQARSRMLSDQRRAARYGTVGHPGIDQTARKPEGILDNILSDYLTDLKEGLHERYRPDPDNSFGNVGSDFGMKQVNRTEPFEGYPNGYPYTSTLFDAAKAVAANTGNVTYNMLPESMTNGVMAPVNRGLSVPVDLGLAGILGVVSALEKVIGYGSEIIGSNTKNEQALAEELMAMVEFGGMATPQGRMLEALMRLPRGARPPLSKLAVEGVDRMKHTGILGAFEDAVSAQRRSRQRDRNYLPNSNIDTGKIDQNYLFEGGQRAVRPVFKRTAIGGPR